jgi:hypothetical protein
MTSASECQFAARSMSKDEGLWSEAKDRPVWSVMRQDDNGNHFEVAHGLTRNAAQEMVRQFEESGHKQYYWVLPKADGITAAVASGS